MEGVALILELSMPLLFVVAVALISCQRDVRLQRTVGPAEVVTQSVGNASLTVVDLPAAPRNGFHEYRVCRDKRCPIATFTTSPKVAFPVSAADRFDFRHCLHPVKSDRSRWVCADWTSVPTDSGRLGLASSQDDDLDRLLLEQLRLEGTLDAISRQIYDLTMELSALASTCEVGEDDPLPDDLQRQVEVLTELGPHRFAESMRLSTFEEVQDWYREWLETKKRSQDNEAEHAEEDRQEWAQALFEAPLIVVGAVGLAYEIWEIHSWQNYLKRARTVKIDDQPVRLHRHSAGYMVEKEDLKKSVDDLAGRLYMEDPISKRILTTDDGRPIPVDWELDKTKLRYSKWRAAMVDAKGKRLVFPRTKDGRIAVEMPGPGQTPARLQFDPKLYVLGEGGLVRRELAQPDEFLTKARIAELENKVDLFRYDPSAGSKLARHLRSAGRYVIIAGSIASIAMGIHSLVRAFELEQDTEGCARIPMLVKSLQSKFLAIKKHRREYLDLKLQIQVRL